MRTTAGRLAILSTLLAAASAQGQIIETVVGGGPNGIPATSACLSQGIPVVAGAPGEFFVGRDIPGAVYRGEVGGNLTLFAGNGANCSIPDPNLGGPSDGVTLSGPQGLLRDPAGNLYIADTSHYMVLRVSASTGQITVVAGTGTQGDSGNGGQATSARLMWPVGLALNSAGDLYISDSIASRVRRVSAATGIITNVAGTGTAGYSGDGLAATGAMLHSPSQIAFDSPGNLYIADSVNHRIRRIDAATGVITTIAGDGTEGYGGDEGLATAASLNYPYGIAVDTTGNVFIGDSINHRIRRVSGGIITTVAGTGVMGFSGDGGPATAADISYPYWVALDEADNILIRSSNRVRRILASTGTIETIAGNGQGLDTCGDGLPAVQASFAWITSVLPASNGDIYFTGGDRVRRLSVATGLVSTAAGTSYGYGGDGGPATSARLYAPVGLALDAAGNLYVADRDNHRIRRVDASTGVITTVAGTGTGGYSGDGVLATSASLNRPGGVALDTAGNLFIADTYNQRIRRVDASTGIITTVAGSGTAGYNGDGIAATSAQINYAGRIMVDTLGRLLISDTLNHRVRRVSGGVITTIAGNGGTGASGDGGAATAAAIGEPSGVSVDGTGSVLVGQRIAGGRVRRISGTTGVIRTIAGGGPACFGQTGGDGGPATAACLRYLNDMALDAAGNAFIVDRDNYRIRRVLLSADLSLTKTDSPDPVYVGDTIVYTLTASNAGPAVAADVTLTDTLPESLTFVSGSAGCSAMGQTVTCTVASLAPGATASFTITVTAGVAAVPSVTNTATLSCEQPDPDTSNNTATQTTTVLPVADLSSSMADSSDPVSLGSSLSYSVTVTNAGPSTATAVTLSDTLDADVTYVSDTGGCAHAAGVVTCSLGDIAASGSASVTITVTTTAAGTISNQATVAASSPADPNLMNNTATEPTLVYETEAGGELPFLTATAREGEALLEWLNPPAPYAETIVRFNTALTFAGCTPPASPHLGTPLVTQAGTAGTRDSFTHTALTSGTTYCYAAFVHKGSGLVSGAKTIMARPVPAGGPVVWGYSTGATATAPVAIGYGANAVSNDNVLHAMVRSTSGGNWPTNWTPFAMTGPAQHRPTSIPIAYGAATRQIILDSQDGHVYSVDAATGGFLWQTADFGMLQAGVGGWLTAFGGAENRLFVGTRLTGADNTLYAIDPATQLPAWSFGPPELIGPIAAQVAVDYDLGYLYFTSEERTPGAETVWCVDLTTHAKVWSRALGSITSALAYRNGRVYVGSDQGVSSPGTLYALDATSNGATIWSFPTTGGAPNDYLLADRLTDDLYFSTSNTVYSLSDAGASHSPNWSTTAIANPSAPLYATGQGLLYVGSSDGRLWQIDTALMPTDPPSALDSVVLGDGLAGVGPPTRDNATSLIYLGTVAGVIYAVQQPLP